MLCVLDSHNAKIFAKAIQALSKFGPDLYIEADIQGFKMQAVNGNRSAVGVFKFFWSFFKSYQLSVLSSDENYCRISMKAFLGVFRKMRMVDTCTMKIDVVHSKIFIEMNCRHQTKKHSIISIIDDQNIAADIRLSDPFPNEIRGPYKVFTDIIKHFQAEEDELTLKPTHNAFSVQNYVDGSWANPKFIRARLSIKPTEFSEYKINEATWITFCLREFRTLIAFAEAIHEDILINYTAPGSPAIFKTSKPCLINAALIMSTLSPDDITPEPVPTPKVRRIHEKKKRSNKMSTTTLHSILSSIGSESRDFRHTVETIPETDFDRSSLDLPRTQPPLRRSSVSSKSNEINLLSKKLRSVVSTPDSGDVVTFMDTEEIERIPASPTNKSEKRKLRSVFVRCFEATFVPREPSPSSDIFVPDSDEEN